MATIQVRLDDNIKAKADSLFESLGLDTSTAVRVFIFKAIEQNGIPFAVERDKPRSTKVKSNSRADMFGCLRGQYKMSDDFDAPLEDFTEYMQ